MQGTKVVKGAVLLVAGLAAVSGTAAFANIGVSSSALNGVANAVRADGSLKPNAVGHMQLKNGIVACEKFTQDLRNVLCHGALAKAAANGKDGAPGLAGQQGVPGANGKDGADGAKGSTGQQGIQGPPGPQAVFDGQNGTNGADGAAGPKGDTGATGPQGSTGPAGSAGPAGVAGPKGSKGDMGLPGLPGIQGFRGFTGPKGDKGEKGDSGPQGERGPAGANGTSVFANSYVRQGHFIVPAGGHADHTTSCNVGDLAVGGGFSFNLNQQGFSRVLQNRMDWSQAAQDAAVAAGKAADANPDGWYAEATGGDADAEGVVWVICLAS